MGSSIINFGTQNSYSLQQNKIIRLLNIMGIMMGCTTIPYCIGCFLYIHEFLGWAILPLIIVSFSMPLLNRAGFFDFSKGMFLGALNATILIYAYGLGPKSGMVTTCFIAIGIPFLFMRIREWPKLIVYCTLPVLIALVILFDIALPLPRIYVSNQILEIFNISVTLTSLLFVCGIILSFYVENAKHMFRLSQSLRQANDLVAEKERTQVSLIKAKNEAEQSAKARKEFLSTMSHEIRTPLNAIIGLTGLLTETKLDDQQKEFINIVRLSGESLLSIINDVLDYSKIESGKVDLEEHPFEIASPIEDVLDLMSGKADEKDLELIYYLEEDVPIAAYGDSARLRQVLLNLVNNALKFTEKGEVVIQVKYITTQDHQHTLQFEVRDTGIGIPQEKMDRLFKSFSQVDASTTRKYGGTGLGLVISQRLVELMGGKIWIKSKLGEGTSFFFTINLREMDTDQFQASSVPVDLSGKKAILIDDNHTNLKILQLQCKKWGLDADICSDPIRGTQLALQNHYDLAILDMCMPQQNGVEVAHAIKAEKDIPIILLSSIVYKIEEEDRFLFHEVLTKPAKQKFLRLCVQTALMQQDRIASMISPANEQKNKAPVRKDLKILLAEDNIANQKVFTQIMKKLGYKIDVAGNGVEVLEAVKLISYDLIFMDVQMPEMDGLEATQEIIKWYNNNPEARPRIIALTASAFKEDKDRCLEAGMDEFLSKPVKKKSIREVLENAHIHLNKLTN